MPVTDTKSGLRVFVVTSTHDIDTKSDLRVFVVTSSQDIDTKSGLRVFVVTSSQDIDTTSLGRTKPSFLAWSSCQHV